MEEENEVKRPWWAPDAQGFVMGSIVIMAAIVLFYRMTHPSDVQDKTLEMMITILYGTAFVTMVNFLMGSSRGSEKKDNTISKIATEPVAPVAPVVP